MNFLVRHLPLVRVRLKHINNTSLCHSGSWSPVSFPWKTIAANLGWQPVCVYVFTFVWVSVTRCPTLGWLCWCLVVSLQQQTEEEGSDGALAQRTVMLRFNRM